MSKAHDTLLSVSDLAVDFRQGGNVTHAVKGVSFEVKRGETLALVGESGSGKSVTALSILKLLPYPAAHHPSGTVMFKGEDLLDNDEDDLRRVRGNDITMIFQEPMTSLNPLHTVERQIGEILALHQGLREDAARADTGAARQGRHPRCRKPPRGISAPAVGRAAAAHDDCHGAGQQSGTADCR
jgi:microcin C transport system ATP-binding protein